MNPKALFNITYGLYLLSTKANGKDNACIINTAVQVASEPLRISISVNKGNLTHDMILESGRFNVSALTTSTPFALFQRFGMQSGRSADKFDGFENVARAENGILYLTGCANAYLCCKVERTVDLGSHTLFIAELEDAEVLSGEPSCTYGYYQSDISLRLCVRGRGAPGRLCLPAVQARQGGLPEGSGVTESMKTSCPEKSSLFLCFLI